MLVPTSHGTNTALYPPWASRGSPPPPGWASSVGVLNFFIACLCILLQLPHLSLPSLLQNIWPWVGRNERILVSDFSSLSFTPSRSLPFFLFLFTPPRVWGLSFSCLFGKDCPSLQGGINSPLSLVTMVYGSRNTRSIMENFLKIYFLSPGILVSVTSSFDLPSSLGQCWYTNISGVDNSLEMHLLLKTHPTLGRLSKVLYYGSRRCGLWANTADTHFPLRSRERFWSWWASHHEMQNHGKASRKQPSHGETLASYPG